MDKDAAFDRATSRRSAVGWIMLTAGSQAWRLVVGLASVAILARFLTPADFGLVATAAPILNLVMMLQTLGLNHALIQRRAIDQSEMNALFWLAFGASVALAGLLYLGTPALAEFFDQPKLTLLLNVTVFLVIIAGLAAQPVALLHRHLQFRELSIIDTVGVTIGIVGSVLIAYYTSSYWALYFPTAATLLTSLVGATIVSGWRIGWPRFDKAVPEMMRFGAGMSVVNVAYVLRLNVDKLLIARAHGAEMLGFYDRASRLTLTPLLQASSPITRVLSPVLSRLQDQPAHYRATYFDAASGLTLLIQPPLLTAVVFSDATIRIVLGEQWLAVAPIFMWLGIASLHQVFSQTLSWLFISQGRIGELTPLALFGSVVMMSSYVIGLPWGPLGVAVAFTLSEYAIRAPISWWTAGRKGHVRLKDLVATAAPHALAIGVSSAVLLAIHAFRPLPGLIELAGLVCCTYLIQAATLTLFPAKRDLFRRGLKMLVQLKRSKGALPI